MPKFPAPRSGDPDFVIENAIFLALADPAARRILELLRREPSSISELVEQIGGQSREVETWIANLEAAGLIAQDPEPFELVRLEADGLTVVRDWIASFK